MNESSRQLKNRCAYALATLALFVAVSCRPRHTAMPMGPSSWPPVHPAWVRELIGPNWLAGTPPAFAGINIEAVQHPPAGAPTAERKGNWLGYRPATDYEQWFGYQHLGQLTDGTHVLRIADWGGGSGVFHRLALLRTQSQPVMDLGKGQAKPRTVLMLAATYELGDRSTATITIRGDVVVVGSSPYGRRRVLRLR